MSPTPVVAPLAALSGPIDEVARAYGLDSAWLVAARGAGVPVPDGWVAVASAAVDGADEALTALDAALADASGPLLVSGSARWDAPRRAPVAVADSAGVRSAAAAVHAAYRSAQARLQRIRAGVSHDVGVGVLVLAAGAPERHEATHDAASGEAHGTVSAQVAALADLLGTPVEVSWARDATGAAVVVSVSALALEPAARIRVAFDRALHAGGSVDARAAALRSVSVSTVDTLVRPRFRIPAGTPAVAKGVSGCAGVATGRVARDVREARELHARGVPVILVCEQTAPEDFAVFSIVEGVLAARGGETSHAAVVARTRNVPCVVGCRDLTFDPAARVVRLAGRPLASDAWLTVDGATGEVFEGRHDVVRDPDPGGGFATMLGWADDVARLGVRANADTPDDAARARALGAVGIGLCRTEHMFFEPSALAAVRRMLLAETPRSREAALAVILPMQRDAFVRLFSVMDGLPVTIRLLDPPLHEFLPRSPAEIAIAAADLGVGVERLSRRLEGLVEVNPMLGHRGVRVGITTPEIYAMQLRAIIEATALARAAGVDARPEILVPFVADAREVALVRDAARQVVEAVQRTHPDVTLPPLGAMIELPRAAICAGPIAEVVEFFSLGTNDLTQMAWGLSRDDASSFMPDYERRHAVTASPLVSFDVEGVGALLELAITRGRAVRPDLRVGACGEHAGNPDAIAWFASHGVDYVSCAPARIPAARWAAARDVLDRA